MSVSWNRRFFLPLAGSLVIAAVTGLAPVDAMPADQAFSSAASVVVQLQSSRPGMTLLSDYSQTTDPERLLGLPGQYLARATFYDPAVTPDPTGVTGMVEVFAQPKHLAARLQTLDQTLESDLPIGPVLLRLFPAADQTTLAAYRTALYALVLT
jgi:hypothetical protein